MKNAKTILSAAARFMKDVLFAAGTISVFFALLMLVSPGYRNRLFEGIDSGALVVEASGMLALLLILMSSIIAVGLTIIRAVGAAERKTS